MSGVPVGLGSRLCVGVCVECPALDSAVSNCGDVVNIDNNVRISKDAKAIDDVVDLEVSERWSEAVNIVLSSGHSEPRSSTLRRDL